MSRPYNVDGIGAERLFQGHWGLANEIHVHINLVAWHVGEDCSHTGAFEPKEIGRFKRFFDVDFAFECGV